MIFPIVRTFVRRPQSTVAALTANRVAFTPTNPERVAKSYSILVACQNTHIGNNGSSFTSRSFATRPASRPKAHTGRATSSPRKKALPAAGAATAKKATSTTKPRAKPGPKTRAKPGPKPRAKSGPKPRAKAKAKPKAKPGPKPKPKVLTAEQKTRADVKKLKKSALAPPKQLPDNAWKAFFVEQLKDSGLTASAAVKAASPKYRSLSPEELEYYNHIAAQNRAQNATAYQEWLKSHSPEDILKANNARRVLSQRHNRAKPKTLKDDRRVKRPRSPINYFTRERYSSGDFKGIKVPDAHTLIVREFKGLTDSEKKKYRDAADQDLVRYWNEVKSVYHRDIPRGTKLAPAA